MGRFLVILALAAGLLAALAAPAGSGGVDPPAADGLLVLGVAGHGPGSRAVTREEAAVANPRTGELRARRLSGGALCHGPVLAVGDHVVFSGHRGRHPVARALPLSLKGPARSLGHAETFAPSAVHGRLWLGRWRGRRKGARLGLHQVDLEGRSSVSARILGGRWGSLHAAMERGFVLGIRDSLVIWDNFRDTPARTIRSGWFMAAGRSRVAWCRGRCRAFRVWSRAGERLYRPPAGVRPTGPVGALSPDQLRLATGVTVRGRSRLAVVDLSAGRWMLVPGGRLGGYRAIAWSPSGQWLYFTASNRRVLGWRFGGASAAPLPIEPGGTVMSLATAAGGRSSDARWQRPWRAAP